MKLSLLSLLAVVSTTASLFAEPLVIIDTKFDLPPVDGKLALTPAVESESALPIKAPTRMSAIEPSSVSPGTEALGDVKPPYALFKDEGREANFEASGNPGLNWSLGKLAFDTGKYELTCRITPLTATLQGARVQVVLIGEDGNPIAEHIGLQPLYVNFSNDRLMANAGRDRASVVISEGTQYTVQIRFDLDQNVWSVLVDGTPLFENLPFSQRYLDASPSRRIGAVSIRSEAGYGDKPNASWAVSELKLVRIP